MCVLCSWDSSADFARLSSIGLGPRTPTTVLEHRILLCAQGRVHLKCDFGCGCDRSGVNISRIEAHFTCDEAIYDQAGISACDPEKCPAAVKDEFLTKLTNKAAKKKQKTTHDANVDEARSAEAKERAQSQQQNQTTKGQQKIRMQFTAKHEVENAISDFFVAEDIPFNKVDRGGEKTIRNYAAEGSAPPPALAQAYRCYYWRLGKLDEMLAS